MGNLRHRELKRERKTHILGITLVPSGWKLPPLGQVPPAVCFCKFSWHTAMPTAIGALAWGCFCATAAKWSHCAEAAWPAEPRILTPWPFADPPFPACELDATNVSLPPGVQLRIFTLAPLFTLIPLVESCPFSIFNIFFFVFLGPHPRHIGVQSELQLPPYRAGSEPLL